ncbi:MAG: lysophospholipid acyltransferase family protein [Elusimicrobiota bacterium]|nr:lysophospholipid acyltransferase family protein [Elusimicrobiota bacterium]
MIRKVVPYLFYAYVTVVGWTTRQRVLRADIPEKVHAAGERFIYAFWHQRQVFFTWSHRNVSAAVLVSKSNDGEMIARTMELSGIDAVRGSSSRGGAAAARVMVEILRSGRDVGITPDGPRGPAREVKEGAVRVAQLAGMPIVPIANALSHRLEIAKAWDRFQVPLPFGRAVVIYGEPVRVGAGDDLGAKAAELKAAMDALTAEADRLVR